MVSPVESLPIELLLRICEFLPMATLATIAPVNKQWRTVTTKLLYTVIERSDWKPKRVSICLQALSSSLDGTLSTIVRHLDLSLWSTDPALSLLLVKALIQTKLVIGLRLTMSEMFSQHFETHLLEYGIIAWDSVGEGEPERWLKQFLPHLEELELSSGYKPFQLAAGRPVRCVSSLTHLQYHALQCLLPFFRRSRGPIQSIHFYLTGRDTMMASQALKMTARMLPFLTHVFINVFVSKRAHVRVPLNKCYPSLILKCHIQKFTPDLLEDLSTLSSLRSVELLLSRSARSPDPFLYSHFAALHTLKATACHLTQVILDTIHWQYRAPGYDSDDIYGWSPLPSDVRTHGWWLEQYGDVSAAHAAMLVLWNDNEYCIPLQHEIRRSISPNDHF